MTLEVDAEQLLDPLQAWIQRLAIEVQRARGVGLAPALLDRARQRWHAASRCAGGRARASERAGARRTSAVGRRYAAAAASHRGRTDRRRTTAVARRVACQHDRLDRPPKCLGQLLPASTDGSRRNDRQVARADVLARSVAARRRRPSRSSPAGDGRDAIPSTISVCCRAAS